MGNKTRKQEYNDFKSFFENQDNLKVQSQEVYRDARQLFEFKSRHEAEATRTV